MSLLFFFNDPPPPEIYTLSLHDALPISIHQHRFGSAAFHFGGCLPERFAVEQLDRKSTRLNSSHVAISYAVFCLKKKNQHTHTKVMSTLPSQRSMTGWHVSCCRLPPATS